jgi:hypothetical protein
MNYLMNIIINTDNNNLSHYEKYKDCIKAYNKKHSKEIYIKNKEYILNYRKENKENCAINRVKYE